MAKRAGIPVVLFACSMMLAACDTTPPAVSTLMQQVAQACQADDKNALRTCYATEGVTAEQIDQGLGGWDAYLDKTSGSDNWTYSSISYVSMADASKDKDILPDTIAVAQGTTMGGVRIAPNIKVVGFITVWFKQPDGTKAASIQSIGMASDGTAKIALEETQH